MFSGLKKIFRAYTSNQKTSCPHCGGARCLGICANSLNQLVKIEITGKVQDELDGYGRILTADKLSYKFKSKSNIAKKLLKRCPPGSNCTVVALSGEGKFELEKLISATPAHE